MFNAKRMLEGQVIYRDFHQFTLPGTEVFYLGLFRFFGARNWIPNAMLIILGLGLAWLTTLISKNVMCGWAVFLPGALFLTVGFVGYLDAAHHWYSTLAVMAAIAVVIEKRTLARLAMSGTLCGIATCFTQTRGLWAVIGLGLFVLWEGRQKSRVRQGALRCVTWLFGAFLSTVAIANVYFVWKVGLWRFLDSVVLFTFYYYPDTQGNAFQVWLEGLRICFKGLLPISRSSIGILPYRPAWLLMYALVPFIYVVFFLIYWHKAHVQLKEHWDRLMLLNITGLFLFLGVAYAPSWGRLCTVSPPAMIILVWTLSSLGKLRQTLERLLWVAVIVWASVGPLKNQFRARWTYLEAPSGRMAFTSPTFYEKYQWLLQRTHPGEFFFHAASALTVGPYFYYPLDLRNPAEVSWVESNDYTRPEQVQNIVEALGKYRVRFVLWSTDIDHRDKKHAGHDHLEPLRSYVRNNYHLVKTFSDLDQVWERNS